MSAPSIYKIYDICVLVLLIIFFVGYVNIHSAVIGIPKFLPTSDTIEQIWEVFSWTIFVMLAIDIYLKYRKSCSEPRVFLKKHWLEIAMLVMIPVFAGLKVAKLSINLVKALKMTKSGFKVAHGAKKMSKRNDTTE